MSLALSHLKRVPALRDLRIAYSWHGNELAHAEVAPDTTAGMWLVGGRTDYSVESTRRAGRVQRDTAGTFSIVVEVIKLGSVTTDGTLERDLQFEADQLIDNYVAAIDEYWADHPRLESDLLYWSLVTSVDRDQGPVDGGVGARRIVGITYRSRQL